MAEACVSKCLILAGGLLERQRHMGTYIPFMSVPWIAQIPTTRPHIPMVLPSWNPGFSLHGPSRDTVQQLSYTQTLPGEIAVLPLPPPPPPHPFFLLRAQGSRNCEYHIHVLGTGEDKEGPRIHSFSDGSQTWTDTYDPGLRTFGVEKCSHHTECSCVHRRSWVFLWRQWGRSSEGAQGSLCCSFQQCLQHSL